MTPPDDADEPVEIPSSPVTAGSGAAAEEAPPGGLPHGRAAVTVRPITAREHEAVLRRHPGSSFLQNPRWALVKTDWHAQSLGFERAGRLVGAALVLHRPVPVPRWIPVLGKASLAYIAEGPVLDADIPLQEALPPLVERLRADGAFEVRMGLPGVVRRWDAEVVRRALNDPGHVALLDVEHHTVAEELAKEEVLRDLGWQAPEVTEDFPSGQPMFQARIPLEGLDVDGVLRRMNQTSRAQTRKSTRTELTVRTGGAELLPDFHALYREAAERESFGGRPLAYFERLVGSLQGSPVADAEVVVASHDDAPLAAAVTVRQGEFAWYSYGGSSFQERKRYAPRAVQLAQLTAALEAGCRWYDLGGVSGSVRLDHELAGLTVFKTAMGADVVQTHGEWELPLNRPLARAFHLYLARH